MTPRLPVIWHQVPRSRLPQDLLGRIQIAEATGMQTRIEWDVITMTNHPCVQCRIVAGHPERSFVVGVYFDDQRAWSFCEVRMLRTWLRLRKVATQKR